MDVSAETDMRQRLASVAIDLNVALKNIRLYGPGHPVAALSSSGALEELSDLLYRNRRITLKVIEKELIFEGDRILEDSSSVEGLVSAFSTAGVQSITFLRGLTHQELAAFLELLTQEQELLERAGGIAEAAKQCSHSHLLVEDLHYLVDKGEETIAGKGDGGGGSGGGADLAAREVYLSALGLIREVVADSRAGRPIPSESVAGLAQALVDQVLRNESALTALTSMKTFDEYTFQHCVNLCIFALALGSRIGLTRQQLVELGVCAVLHDAGKIFVPLEILRKPGKLTPEEWAQMEQHTLDGAALLAAQPGLPVLAPVVAYEHHLRHDLSGYPRPSHRKSLNLFSSIIGLADCYDALTTPRPYRKPLMPKQALEVMQEARDKDFEPRLLNYFIEMVGPYPVGSCLEMTDGTITLVTKVDSRPPFDLWLLPLLTPTGEPIPNPEQTRLPSQAIFAKGEGRKIRQAVDPENYNVDLPQILADLHKLAH